MTKDEELNKTQYLEVSKMIDSRFKDARDTFTRFEHKNDLFLHDLKNDVVSLNSKVMERVEVLEDMAYRYKTWLYTLSAVIGFCAMYIVNVLKGARLMTNLIFGKD